MLGDLLDVFDTTKAVDNSAQATNAGANQGANFDQLFAGASQPMTGNVQQPAAGGTGLDAFYT